MRQVVANLILILAMLGACAQVRAEQVGVARIRAALQSRDFATALGLARASLKQNPKQAPVLAMEGFAYAALGREKEALAAFRAALRIDPHSLPALEGAAQIEFNAGDAGADELLRRIVQLHPEDPKSHAILALVAYRKNDCTAAIEQFRKANVAIAGQPLALAEYASCLVDLNRAGEAVPLLRQAMTIDPADSHLRYNLAVAQQAASMSKDAIATLQPLLEGANPDPDALDLAAAAHEDLTETQEALRLLRLALIADPSQLKYYMDLASLAFKHSSWDVGLDVVNLGLKQLPKAAPLYVARGILNVQMSNLDAARADFETANRLDPAQTGGSISQAMAYIQQRDPAKALDAIEAQLRVHPDDALLEYLKALSLSKKGTAPGSAEFAQAMDAARKAAGAEHGFPTARDLLAEMDLETSQFMEAQEQSRLALKEDPTDEKALYQLIRALRASGKDPDGELPALTRRMSKLLAQKRTNETTESKYKLYEPDAVTNKPVNSERSTTQLNSNGAVGPRR
jgi:tetratricopeptide (TPR) repeat protein